MELAARIHRKLGLGENEPLPVAFHKSATKSMHMLYGVLSERPGEAGHEIRQLLMFTGISVQRRILLGEGSEEEVKDLGKTLTLLFVLVAKASQVAVAPGKSEYETQLLLRWGSTSLWQRVLEASSDAGTWSDALRLSPEAVCRAGIVQARAHAASATIEDLAGPASTFFRASSTHLAYTLLGSAPVRGGEPAADFLTLGAVDLLREANDHHEERLATICAAAETEAGQQASCLPCPPLVRAPRANPLLPSPLQILRDLILSFRLPPSIVGVRRNLPLSRTASRAATKDFPEVLQAAHEAAMRGAEYSWASDEEQLHKACALLAGVAILFAGRGGVEEIRTKAAFDGRVALPCFEAPAPAPGVTRMMLVPHRAEWVVYRVDKQQSVEVMLRHRGFEGLCMAVLLLTKK